MGRQLIVFFFGIEYEGSVIPFFILLPGLTAMGVFRILTDHLKSLNLPSIGSVTAFIGFGCNIIVTFLFLAPDRIYAASLGYSTAFVVSAGLVLLYYIFKLKVPVSDLLFIRASEIEYYVRMVRQLKHSAKYAMRNKRKRN